MIKMAIERRYHDPASRQSPAEVVEILAELRFSDRESVPRRSDNEKNNAKDCAETELHCLLELTSALRKLATYLDHIEHNQPSDATNINTAGKQLRQVAVTLALQNNISLKTIYGQRLRAIEEKSIRRLVPLYRGAPPLLGSETIAEAQTWADLQNGQLLHDEQFNPRLLNNSELQQLQHYFIHISKLPDYLLWAMMENDRSTFYQKHLADIIAFGVKLATLRDEMLPSQPLDSSASFK